MARLESSIGTDDVLLRDVVQGDLPVFFEYQRDPVSNRMAGVPSRNRDAFATHWAKILSDRAFTIKTILFEERVAGYVMSFERDDQREVGYWIGREYWGKGIATAALSRFLTHAEARRPLHAKVAKHNVGSIHVLKKSGFTLAGEADGAYALQLAAG